MVWRKAIWRGVILAGLLWALSLLTKTIQSIIK
jgi:hypothetical protein